MKGNTTTHLSAQILVQRFGKKCRPQSTHVHHQGHYSNSLLRRKNALPYNYFQHYCNPLSSNSDENQISLYIITACSNIQVMRIKEVISKDKMS